MDFATEERLCRLAHEVWRRAAAEPGDGPGGDARCVDEPRQPGGTGRTVLSALHLQDVYVLDTRDMLCW